MPRIFDNIDQNLLPALKQTLGKQKYLVRSNFPGQLITTCESNLHSKDIENILMEKLNYQVKWKNKLNVAALGLNIK